MGLGALEYFKVVFRKETLWQTSDLQIWLPDLLPSICKYFENKGVVLSEYFEVILSEYFKNKGVVLSEYSIHSLKLGKKRRKSSKRNYYMICPKVKTKAIIITVVLGEYFIESSPQIDVRVCVRVCACVYTRMRVFMSVCICACVCMCVRECVCMSWIRECMYVKQLANFWRGGLQSTNNPPPRAKTS